MARELAEVIRLALPFSQDCCAGLYFVLALADLPRLTRINRLPENTFHFLALIGSVHYQKECKKVDV